MKIDRMKTGDWGNVRAYFSLQFSEGPIVKGFKIINGRNGLFVAPPSIKNAQGDYHDQVIMGEARDEIRSLALERYNEETSPGGDTEAPPPEEPHFDDDDIPF